MEYVVFRTGYNAANNPAREGGCETVPVARVTADSAGEAVRLAGRRVSCYHNQSLSAVPAADYDAEQKRLDDAVRPV